MKHFKLYYKLAIIALATIATFAVSALILTVLGANVLDTFYVIFVYPLTNLINFSEVINRMTPLCIVALGICVAYRSGIINIGGEGQMTVGLLLTIVVILFTDLPRPVIVPLGAAVRHRGRRAVGLRARRAQGEVRRQRAAFHRHAQLHRRADLRLLPARAAARPYGRRRRGPTRRR